MVQPIQDFSVEERARYLQEAINEWCQAEDEQQETLGKAGAAAARRWEQAYTRLQQARLRLRRCRRDM